jgi:hypothetical protein
MEGSNFTKTPTSSVNQKLVSRYEGVHSDEEADKPKTLPLEAPAGLVRPLESERKIRVSQETLNLDAKNLKFYQVAPAKPIREDKQSKGTV